ncbi:hypothetical protein QBC46DRAFT_118963 [Diplogelasinospora grovesii]|uniref:Uncharacterized protein n=1 Tax=Diplogelasinospora grovesii TaxID=303347 RepID=A0AAN6S5K0_9PEZI|nr:hypothetical protein QBC46DRAFT_118963 [Diplogelasinospora grovesii]
MTYSFGYTMLQTSSVCVLSCLLGGVAQKDSSLSFPFRTTTPFPGSWGTLVACCCLLVVCAEGDSPPPQQNCFQLSSVVVLKKLWPHHFYNLKEWTNLITTRPGLAWPPVVGKLN